MSLTNTVYPKTECEYRVHIRLKGHLTSRVWAFKSRISAADTALFN